MSTRPLVLLRRPVALLASLTLVGVAVALPSPASAETSTGRYIISTRSAAGTDDTVAALARSGTEPRHRFDRVFNGFSATLTPKQVILLRRSRWVRSVTPDRVVRVDTTQTSAPWGLDRLDLSTGLNGTYAYATDGAGVSVFELDTGVRLSHTQFGGRARSGWDFVDSDPDADDCHGHGTHVAGTATGSTYGVAKAARVVALRVLDCEGGGYDSDFIAALQWVIENESGPSVVNISAGGEASEAMDEAVAAVVKAGVPVVVAAGNENTNACLGSPARAGSALTVGATERDDSRAGYSNYGSCVDIFAPGSAITSAGLSSDVATATMSGTSMATPHVAGAVARYLQANPKASPAEVRSAMLGDATANRLSDVAGSPNKLLYLRPRVAGSPASPAQTHSDPARTATLTWKPPYGFGSQTLSGYQVTRSGTDTAGRSFAPVSLGSGARSYVFGSLKPGTTYNLTVQALSSNGAGPGSTATVKTLALPGPGRVSAPSTGSTKDGSTVSITSRWKAPSTGGAVTSYAIEARRVSNHKTTTASASASARSRKVTKLSKATYQVRVRAVNAAGRGSWSPWSAKTKAR